MSTRNAAFEWLVSRTSGVALVATEDVARSFEPYWRPRPLRHPREANPLAVALCDGWYLAIDAVFNDVSSRMRRAAYVDYRGPSYAVVRNYLAFDCDIDYHVACIVAWRHTKPLIRVHVVTEEIPF